MICRSRNAARDVTGATSSGTPRAYTQTMQERAAIWPRTLEDRAVLEDCDMSDELLETLPLVAVLIEVVVFGWAFLRKNVSGVVLVNAIGAAAVIALIAPELKVSLQFADVFLVLQVVILAFAHRLMAHPSDRPLFGSVGRVLRPGWFECDFGDLLRRAADGAVGLMSSEYGTAL
jgi:hypothetical protein